MKKNLEPFDNDSMMKKLHEIHHQIYEETKNMTSKEIANKINQEAEEFLMEMGYSLVPTGGLEKRTSLSTMEKLTH